MFNKMLIARVGLPREVWEPLRKLFDYGVDLNVLADSWLLSEREMLRVLYAARLAQLDKGEEEVRWLEELGDGNANAVPAGR